MKHVLVLLGLLAPFILTAQGTPKSLLWRIAGNGPDRIGYVYGTMHSKSERAYTHSGLVESYMDSVGTVAGELDLDAGRSQGMALMNAMMMPEGKRLEDLYKKKEWRVVEAGLQEKLGAMAGMVMRMKPIMVLAMLTEASMEEDRERLLDDHLLNQAKTREHRVIGLESMQEQLRAMDALSLKEQAALLLDHFKNGGHEKEMEAMLVAYVEQDLDALMKVAEAGSSMPEAVERSLITERNKIMAHRMDSVLSKDGPSMFLIGAAHLPGEEGVLQLMRSMGYRMEPVFRTPATTDAPMGASIVLAQGIHYINDSLGYGVDMPGMPIDGGDGILIHADREKDRAVFVTVIARDGGATDLDAFVHKQFELDASSEVKEQWVQGLEGRRVRTRFNARDAEMLVIGRDDRVFVLTAVDPDVQYRDQVFRSFHFTDLPDPR